MSDDLAEEIRRRVEAMFFAVGPDISGPRDGRGEPVVKIVNGSVVAEGAVIPTWRASTPDDCVAAVVKAFPDAHTQVLQWRRRPGLSVGPSGQCALSFRLGAGRWLKVASEEGREEFRRRAQEIACRRSREQAEAVAWAKANGWKPTPSPKDQGK